MKRRPGACEEMASEDGDETSIINEDGEEIMVKKRKAVTSSSSLFSRPPRAPPRPLPAPRVVSSSPAAPVMKEEKREVLTISDEDEVLEAVEIKRISTAKERAKERREREKEQRQLEKEIEAQVSERIKQHDLQVLAQPAAPPSGSMDDDDDEVLLDQTQARLQRYYASKEYSVSVSVRLELPHFNLQYQLRGAQDFAHLLQLCRQDRAISPYAKLLLIHEGQPVVSSATIAALGGYHDHLSLSLHTQEGWEQQALKTTTETSGLLDRISTLSHYTPLSNQEILTPQQSEAGMLSLRIRTRSVEQELQVSRYEPLQGALEAFQSLHPEATTGRRLYFDGQTLNLTKSPAELGLEDDDVLEFIA